MIESREKDVLPGSAKLVQIRTAISGRNRESRHLSIHPPNDSRRWSEGWPFVGAATVILVTITIAVLADSGLDGNGIRALIRTTVRSSLALFLVAFTAFVILALLVRLSAFAMKTLRPDQKAA